MGQSRDPVCGMNVDTERAPAQGVYGGETVYFCCTGCRRKYEATRRPDGRGVPAA
jgi:P-type Cu+ transporter